MRRILFFAIALMVAVPWLVRPGDVPSAWAPWAELDLTDPPNFIWRQKVRTLGYRPDLCLAAIGNLPGMVQEQDRKSGGHCGISPHVSVTRLGAARLAPLNTQCAIAARLYLWHRHDLDHAARKHLGSPVARIRHFGSFSCRRMRTSSGRSSRWSQHATANAVDIAGFVLADGRQIRMSDWQGTGPKAAFLRAARDGLCRWFNTVLSPDYNALHADHFHADMGRWPVCR